MIKLVKTQTGKNLPGKVRHESQLRVMSLNEVTQSIHVYPYLQQ